MMNPAEISIAISLYRRILWAVEVSDDDLELCEAILKHPQVKEEYDGRLRNEK